MQPEYVWWGVKRASQHKIDFWLNINNFSCFCRFVALVSVPLKDFIGSSRGILTKCRTFLSLSFSLFETFFSFFIYFPSLIIEWELFCSSNIWGGLWKRGHTLIWQPIFDGSKLIFKSYWKFQLKYKICRMIHKLWHRNSENVIYETWY